MAQQSFSRRNGYARLSDLAEPSLAALLERCLDEAERFDGRRHLDWSRQWEYPYVLANLPEPGEAEGARVRVLDAGCGWRFFAPMLAGAGYEVEACDLDETIGPKTRALAESRRLPLHFQREDLEALSYPDDHFDAIACVSVLEHTPNPERVMHEFVRCLRPGGRLILTFDVSLDGERDISLAGARGLVEILERELVCEAGFADPGFFDAAALRADADVLRTASYRERRPELLPWRWVSRATFECFMRGRFGRPFFDLAVVGAVGRKATR